MEGFFLAEADLDAVAGDLAGFDVGGEHGMLGWAFSEAWENRAREADLDGVAAARAKGLVGVLAVAIARELAVR